MQEAADKAPAALDIVPGLQDVVIDFDEALEQGKKAIQEQVEKIDKTPTELYNEVRESLVAAPPEDDEPVEEINIADLAQEPELEIKAEQVKKFDEELTEEKAPNVARRNVNNASRAKGVNRPVIAGPAGLRRRTKEIRPTQPMKSIPGKRSGVHTINEDAPVNDSSRVTMNKGVHKPGQKGVGTSVHGRRTGVHKIK
jgi:hypothetical protein